MDYELEDQVGLGTFGKVFRARHIRNGRLYALKLIKMETEREGFPVTAVREAKILSSLRHQSIISLVEIVKSSRLPENDSDHDANSASNGVFFVFPYFEYDMVGLMRMRRLSYDDVRFIVCNLLHALAYLHSNAIVHRDIKPSNILISHAGTVCLGDFGLARNIYSPDFHETRPLTNRVVTLWYRAPELLLGATRYNEAVDVWAAGCVLYEALTGTSLFCGNDEFSALDAIGKRMGAPLSQALNHLPWYGAFNEEYKVKEDPFADVVDTNAKDLLIKMLAVDPSKRISARDAQGHSFFQGLDSSHRIGGLKEGDSVHEFKTRDTVQ